MNNKGESGFGIVKTIGVFLVVIALISLLFVQNDLFADVKEAFPDTSEFKEIVDEVYLEDEDLELREAESIVDDFIKLFKVEGNDCIATGDFGRYDRNFIVNFKLAADGDNRIEAGKEGSKISATGNARHSVFFNPNGERDFKILEFNRLESGSGSYGSENLQFYKSPVGNIFFLGFNDALDLVGLKPVCGEAELGVNSPGGGVIVDYLKNEVDFLDGSYFVYQLLNYVSVMEDLKSSFSNSVEGAPQRIAYTGKIDEVNKVLESSLGDHLESLSIPNADKEKCWEVIVNDSFAYGNIEGEKLLYKRTHVKLSNSRILKIDLSVGLTGCISPEEVNELLGEPGSAEGITPTFSY